jgi:hypothetical protein
MSDAAIRASAAKRLADDPILVEAFENIRKAAIQVWQSTAADNVAGRETAWLTVKVVNRIEAELQSIIDGGLIAASRVAAPVR